MTGGFRLHGLFESFWSSTPSTVTGGDVCEYRTCSMLMAKVLFDRESSKDKNQQCCFQGYQGDIGCPTREVISDHCVWFGLSIEYRWFSTRSMYCSTPMIWSCFFPSEVFRTLWKISLIRIWISCPSGTREIHCSLTPITIKLYNSPRYHVEFAYMLAATVLDRVSSEHAEVGKAFAMLGFIRRLSFEFREPHSEVSLHVMGSSKARIRQLWTR
jgi:hypothetical protein